jgi:superfamily II DNA or RNA helicase
VEQLRADAALGHILMARVGSIRRAEEVFKCYEKYAEFNPVQIHTGMKSKTQRDEIRRKLLSGESRIAVCVDMLGEGFDLPELKIAAFHDIRKTLAITLQLVGRRFGELAFRIFRYIICDTPSPAGLALAGFPTILSRSCCDKVTPKSLNVTVTPSST